MAYQLSVEPKVLVDLLIVEDLLIFEPKSLAQFVDSPLRLVVVSFADVSVQYFLQSTPRVLVIDWKPLWCVEVAVL